MKRTRMMKDIEIDYSIFIANHTNALEIKKHELAV